MIATTLEYFPSFSTKANAAFSKEENISNSIVLEEAIPLNITKVKSEYSKTTADGWEYYEEDNYITICGYSGTATELMIPDEINGQSVVAIADEAFSGNRRIVSLKLGNVTRLGYKFLEGCVGITEITIPQTVTDAWYALEGSSVETVVFEEGIKNIPDLVCYNAANLKNVIIPEKEDNLDGYVIGDSAFWGTSLETIKIPDSVTRIGNNCFYGCKRLKTLSLGKSVSSLGERFLEGCVGITEITIPQTVTDAWYALEGSSIETLIIEPGMKTTPEYLAAECQTLRTVYLPDSVSEIGDYSFAGCKNLEKIKSNRTTFNFSAHSFEGCEKLDDARFSILDPENTYLIANSEQTSVNGIINYTLKYKLMPSVAKSAENMEIHLNIPEGLTLLLDTVQSKNLVFDTESIDNGVIPVNSTEGELRFSVRVTEVGEYQVYASLNFNYNNSWWEQTIGRLNVDCPDITCCSLEKTNSYEITVHGLASKGSEVEIYVDDKKAKTVTSNSYTGKYSSSVSLLEKKSGDSYTIYAKCNGIISDKISVVYEENHPSIKSVLMLYNSNEEDKIDITNVFTEGVSPVISYNPAYPLKFEIEADHNDKIYKMYVTSTKGNITKYLEAKWDEKKQLWIANGFFDENNHNYIPGALNVTCLPVNTSIAPLKNDRELTIPKRLIDHSSYEVISQNDEGSTVEINLSDGEKNGEMKLSIIESEELIELLNVSPKEVYSNPQKYGFSSAGGIHDDGEYKKQRYIRNFTKEELDEYRNWKYANDLLSAYDDIFSGQIIIEKIVGEDNMDADARVIGYMIGDITEVGMDFLTEGTYSIMTKVISVASDVTDLKVDTMNARGTSYEYAAWFLFGLKLINEVDIISGPVPSAIIDTVEDYLYYCMETGEPFFSLAGYLKFIIDPSGIVFEAVIGNPVEGATVTVYFKDAETGETVKWNAEDYDQLNPLLTDKEGKYLWDVPEGEWKVVCEKEGYETVETEWIDIPPVRTDVNISLINKSTPAIESANMENTDIIIKFNKFIDISTVTPETLIIDDFNGNYIVSPQLIDENDKYADTFIISGKFTNQIKSISITDKIISYAGTATEKSSIAIKHSESMTDYKLGDVNNDGQINSVDASFVLAYYAKVSTNQDGGYSDAQKAAADVNNDGSVNSVDASKILAYYAYVSTAKEEILTIEEYLKK